MRIDKLDKLIFLKQLKSYSFDIRNDTGENPYMRLELVFNNGDKIIVLPEPERDDLERISVLVFILDKSEVTI